MLSTKILLSRFRGFLNSNIVPLIMIGKIRPRSFTGSIIDVGMRLEPCLPRASTYPFERLE
ncbi:hypothetical protein MPTK1_6g21220 [Marchantia polymorpha subsp. ruderalis]|uniref:Uncharacterized protein n=2 Tax=Marchantia polymorpha TaxID=3197 RepID=A0AAF6BUF9_MARPO|nr:hypothetical protein MARPO_0091s0033 [Marchantia polymorpha]BBN15643.1 hypothetical protein Mp_6g21220 [Marchantia polymorpha subsp. ruderalis]|eukprot:PTQ33171.1 hypothetical protein MARPO_0091s0033 [Marchantia polymorpha]